MAASVGEIAFIINRAGPPLSWIDVNLYEVENDWKALNISGTELEDLLVLRERIWRYVILAASDEAYALGPEREAINQALEEFSDQGLPRLPAQLVDYDADFYEQPAGDWSYDPRPFLDLIDTPMLYIFTENDLNVQTADSVEFLTEYRARSGKAIEIEVLPNVDHTMLALKYIPTTAGFPPQYFQQLSDFAVRHSQ